MKTVGVIGGLGPQATMDFERQFHQFANALIPPRFNSGYPPLIVYYFRHAPIKIREDGQPQFPIEPDPRLLEGARVLGGVADFLVITANSAHELQPELEAASGRPVLSMVELALGAASANRWKKLGLLGLGEPRVYTSRLAGTGIEALTIVAQLQERLDGAIFRVMEGRQTEEDGHLAREAVESLWKAGSDGIILGCTELPFLLPEIADDPAYINPLRLLAEAAIRQALA